MNNHRVKTNARIPFWLKDIAENNNAIQDH